MDFCKRTAAVAAINLRYWLKDIRVRFLFLCIAVLTVHYMKPFTAYGMASGETCTPWLLPYLFCSGGISMNLKKTVFHIGLLLLLCNAPFLYQTAPYMILRSRRNAWWAGECLYIITAALIYIAFITVVSFLTVLPVVSFGEDWGDVVRSFTMGNGEMTGIKLGLMYNLYNVPTGVFRYLKPLESHIYTFFAAWGSFSILGLLMYVMSLIGKHAIWGMAASAVFVFLDPILTKNSWRFGYWVEALSPVCWTDPGLLKDLNVQRFLTVPFVAVMILVLIALLCVVIWQVSRRITIEVVGED